MSAARPTRSPSRPRKAAPQEVPPAAPQEAPPAAPQGAPEAGGRMTPPAQGVKVRMYRTGLGDCFLLAFPRAPSAQDPRDAFYLLLDCGVFKATENAAARMRAVATDIRAATGGRIDLLVITHEHWDHVSGFHPSQAQDIFRQIDLGAVWLAWTEDETDPMARQMREARLAARLALSRALAMLQGTAAAESPAAGLVRKVLDFFGGPSDTAVGVRTALGARGDATGEALRWVKNVHGQGKVQYLRPGEGPLPLPGVADARVYVLGPPEDPVLIRHSNPSASRAEVYPRALAAAEAAFFAAFGIVHAQVSTVPTKAEIEEARGTGQPFDDIHRVKPQTARRQKFFQEHYFAGEPWRQIDASWLENASDLALMLDSATNNTSLALALEVGPAGSGAVLLFPGDAQVGNWLSWFGKVKVGGRTLGKDMTWTAGGRAVTADDLLARTVLYKVSHHGSHNATLRGQGLERMGRAAGAGGAGELVAMLPVDELVARTKAGYGDMPLPSLVKDLLVRTGGRVMRIDEDAPPDPKGNPTLAGVEGAPARRESFGGKKKTELYIEYTVT